MKRTALIAALEKKFPRIELAPSEDFDGHAGGLWVKYAPDVNVGESQIPMFDMYAGMEDTEEKYWVMGVARPLFDWLKTVGWYAEPHDSETWFLWQ